MAGLIANFQFDRSEKDNCFIYFKSIGIYNKNFRLRLYELSFFHLSIRALFKSIIFLHVGGLI